MKETSSEITAENNNPHLLEVQRNWNEFGIRDPLWAILTDENKNNHGWDLAEFFATGEIEVGEVLTESRLIHPSLGTASALDFGCGVGRLTQAMCSHFDLCHGVDIAASMIDQARQMNRFNERCVYHLNLETNLRLFDNASFDFIYSSIVLQHNRPEISLQYIQEFLRVLKPGGLLVFQIPSEPLSMKVESGMPLPQGACNASLRPDLRAVQWIAGTSVTFSTAITNCSPNKWPETSRIRLGNHWRDENGLLLVLDDARADLSSELLPGETTHLELTVSVPGRPGLYGLELDLVQENICWFSDKGSQSPILKVIVSPMHQIPDEGDTHQQDGLSNHGATHKIAAGDLETVLVPRMEMHGIAKGTMLEFLDAQGAVVLAVTEDHSAAGWISYRYFVKNPGNRF